jgi:radical SAM superfamily enzyme YgiQ (UPF0313 family)
MTPKTISWVQPNFQQGPTEFNAYYLPYSVGVIWAYCKSDADIDQQFKLDQLIWRRDPIPETAKRLAKSDIVAFSTYIWNHNYNYHLAEQVKKLNPDCLIVFGGPEPAIKDADLFVKNPFMDIVIKLEGEVTFKKLLQSYDQAKFDHIPGLLINRQGQAYDTGVPDRISDLDQIPSPYLTGVFDQLIADNPGVEWNATLETNRGCPFACTFCDWGSLTYNKVKKFNLERVYDELEWMGQNRCGFVSITDANFGAFIERDSLIVDKIIEVQERYSYPTSFSVAWAKNQKRDVVNLVRRLMDSPMKNQGLTLSVQSLDLDVLENIKRRNMEDNNLQEVFELCAQQNVPTFTEIILGLPGETLESWKENFWKLFKLGNHTGVTINHAQLLENSEMNLLQKKLYGITGIMNSDYFPGVHDQDNTAESVEIVTGTASMPTPELLTAMNFSWFMNTWHLTGLSTIASRFVYKYLNVDYQDFYQEFETYLQSDPWWRKEQQEVLGYQHNWLHHGKIQHPDIGGIQISGWNLIHRTVQNIQVQNLHDHVFDLLEGFMSKYNLPKDIQNDLNTLQRTYVIKYKNLRKYPMTVNLQHNIWEYINHPVDLSQENFIYYVEFPEDKFMSLQRFLDAYYYHRRRNFGKAQIKKL